MMNQQSFKALGLELNDAIVLQGAEGNEVKGFYLGEYNEEGGTFAFSNFDAGQVEVIVIDNLKQLRKNI
jgi:hypothetical protein